MTRLALIPAPFHLGQTRAGVDTGPEALLSAGLPSQLCGLGHDVRVCGPPDGAMQASEDPEDVPVEGCRNPKAVARAARGVKEAVEAACRDGEVALTLGGDHSLALGTVSGSFAAHPDACLLWIDAHADLNTPQTSDSGSLHGCPLSFLLGITGPLPTTQIASPDDHMPAFRWVQPVLSPDRLVYIAARDLDPAERAIIRKLNIACYTMHDIDRHGIGKVVDMALEAVNPGLTRPIHLSFDIDACDPEVAPSTGTPVRGGLTFREAHYICEAVASTGKLVAMDMMEVNPSLVDVRAQEKIVTVACSIVRAAMGETLL